MPFINKIGGAAPSRGPSPDSLFSFGYNTHGQLGQGNTTELSTPTQVGSLTNWSQVTGLGGTAFGIDTDGKLFSWGRADRGQTGQGNTTNLSSPNQVGSLTDWGGSLKTGAGGGTHTAHVVKSNGTLWGWGENSAGQVGDGATTDLSSPVQIGSLTTWKQVTGGSQHTIAIKTDGTMWSWGSGSVGATGHGNTTNYSSPVQIGSLTTWSFASAGINNFALAVKTDSTLWAWGSNNNGQLGQGNTTNVSSPVQVGSLTTWVKMAAGQYHVMGVDSAGRLWTWGQALVGKTGHGNTTDVSSPVQVGSLTNWTGNLMPGVHAEQAVKSDGTLWAWGQGANGQLGLGNTTNYSSPVQVGSATTWQNDTLGGVRALGYRFTLVTTQES